MLRVLILILLAAMSVPVIAQNDIVAPDPDQYQLQQIAGGMSLTLYATHASDGTNRLFVLEQAGKINIVRDGVVEPTPFLDLTSLVNQDVTRGYSEQGLLGIAFHPEYATNGQFFVHYNAPNMDTIIARYQVSADNPNIADPDSADIIFTHQQPFFNHNGGQLAFGPDGYLYIALGDGGSADDPQNNGQNSNTLLGSILRIDVDGEAPYAIPDDNPISTVNPELEPEIWAWGLRNPWRFSFDRTTGDLYIADVGQNQWEEINFEPADFPGGGNYGWRIMEATHNFSGESDPGNLIPPIAEYDHSLGCSVTGGYVYRGEALPDLQGVYFFGDYCSGRIWTTFLDSAGEWQTNEFMSNTGISISSFGEDEQGELYVVGYNGRVLKLIASQ